MRAYGSVKLCPWRLLWFVQDSSWPILRQSTPLRCGRISHQCFRRMKNVFVVQTGVICPSHLTVHSQRREVSTAEPTNRVPQLSFVEHCICNPECQGLRMHRRILQSLKRYSLTSKDCLGASAFAAGYMPRAARPSRGLAVAIFPCRSRLSRSRR